MSGESEPRGLARLLLCEKRHPITARDTHSSISPQFVEETLKEIDVRIKNEERLREVIPKAGLLNLHVT